MRPPNAWLRALWLAAVCACVLLFALPSFALDVPKLAGRVNDQANLLSSAEAERLEQKLAAHEKATGQQFALLTLQSLEGDPIEEFAVRVFESWKLGKKGKDDGLLLVVALGDRKMKIEVGYGLEGVITDAVASRVIRGTLSPAFKSKDYAGGIARAFDALKARAGGEGSASEPEPAKDRGITPRFGQWLIFLVFFLLFPFLHFINRSTGFGRRGGPFGGGGFYGGGLGGFGGGRSGGGGFGGGGGFSGGGGGSGGGGASGGW